MPGRSTDLRSHYRSKPVPTTPLVLLVLIFFAFAITRFGMEDTENSIIFLMLGGLVVYVTTLVHIQLGIGIMICTAVISPKIEFGGMPLTLDDFIVPVVFFAWITRVIEHKEKLEPTDLKVPILFYVTLTGFSTLIASITYPNFRPMVATTHYFKFIEYFIIYIITLNNIHSIREAKAFIYTLLMISGIMAVISIFFFESIGDDTSRVIGPKGTEPNVLGAYYCFMSMILVSIFAWVRSIPLRFVIIIILSLIVHPVIFSLSRTTWISIGCGLTVIGLYKDKRVMVGTLLVLLVLANFAPDFVRERAATIPDTVTGNTESSWQARQDSWKSLIPLMMKNPLFGSGKGATDLAKADNEYVLQLVEGGILGLMGLLWILFRITRKSYLLLSRTRDPLFRGFAMGVYSGTIALMVHSLATTTFTVIRVMVIYYFVAGMIYAIWNLVEKEQHREDRFSKGYIPASEFSSQRHDHSRHRIPSPRTQV